ncbi:MAG: acyl carrier protein [Candidatus Hydrogenedentes bacterium]|nr:acyl carrier protein [Candidatus Hydrogenedentota bacterium]
MRDILRQFVFDQLLRPVNSHRLTDDDNLLEAGLDSIGVMRLIHFLEVQFDVRLPEKEVLPENLESISAIERWVRLHQSA